MLSNRVELKLFLAFFLIYAIFANYVGWNDDSRILTSVSLLDDKSFDISKYKDYTGDRIYYEGNYYSDKAPLSAVIGISAYSLYKLIYGRLEIWQIDIFNPNYSFLVLLFDLISAVFASASMVVMYKIMKMYNHKDITIYLSLLAFGFGTMVFSQATIFNGHAVALFFLVLSLYLILNNYEFYAGLSIATSFLVDFMVLPVISVYLLYILISKKRRCIRLFQFLVGFLLVSSFIIIYNFFIFNQPFAFSYNYIDTRVFDSELMFYPPFFDCQDSKTLFSALGSYFHNECDYKEKLVYDPNMAMVTSREYSSGAGSKFIGKGSELIFNHSYLSKNGMLNGYERMEYSDNISFNGTYENGILIYTKYYGEDSTWTLSASRLNNNSILVLYQLGSSFFIDRCSLIGQVQKQDFLALNYSRTCSIIHYSKEGRIIKEISFEFSDISLKNETGKLILSREVKSTYPRITRLFFLSRMIMLLLYPYRGFFFYSPIYLFAVFGFMIRRKNLFFMASLVFIFYLMINSIFAFWWGGSSYGQRFMIYSLPFMTILLAEVYYLLGKLWKKLFYLFLIISIFLNLIGNQQLQFTQTNVYLHDGRIRFSENYFDDMILMREIGSPVTEYYLPLFLEKGPSNIIFRNMAGIDFGFFNIILLLFCLVYLKFTIVK